jgi:hypothetical protein
MPVTTTYPSDAGADAGAGPGCTETCSGGSIMVSCVTTTQGYTTTTTYTVSTTTGVGSLSTTTTTPDGGIFLMCSYTSQTVPG